MLYDDGQNYNPQTGFFICEVPGAYYFAYHVRCKEGKVQVALFKNNEPVMDMYEKYKKDLNQVSGRFKLELSPGDYVFVQMLSEQAAGQCTRQHVHATFLGYLLYPM